MAESDASILTYLAGLPADRRATIEAVRQIVLANLPGGYEETFNWGMISYEVPLALSGKTYNGKPLSYAALGNQKNHVALYLNGLYCLPELVSSFERAFAAAGKKLDMGKSCVRFKTVDDLALEAVATAIAGVTPAELVAASRAAPRKTK